MRSTLGRLALGLILVAAVPAVGSALRDAARTRCARDGLPLDGAPVVRIVEPDGVARAFCCVGCAESWLADADRARFRVLVTDEVSRTEIDTANAWFVRSLIPAHPPTLDHVHAFRARDDAERHLRAYRGRMLVGAERPFGFPTRQDPGE